MELAKRTDGAGTAADLMRAPIAWMERQFAALGRPDAGDLAMDAMARYQGAAVLTGTLRDPTVMSAAESRGRGLDRLPDLTRGGRGRRRSAGWSAGERVRQAGGVGAGAGDLGWTLADEPQAGRRDLMPVVIAQLSRPA